MRRIYPRSARALGGIAIAILPVLASLSHAADHADSPATKKDHAADITDLYAWHDAAKINVVLNVAGLSEAGVPADYDAGVLYQIHIDNTGDLEPDYEVLVRFGQNAAGEWGVKVEDLPGIADPIVGPVDTVIDAGIGLRVYAGLRDDPFFFDLDGFNAAFDDGVLMFDDTRDSYAGTNVLAIALEMSRDALTSDKGALTVWASTGRIP
jgi:hypothetical protein